MYIFNSNLDAAYSKHLVCNFIMSDKQVTFEKIKDKITSFVEERDWKKFHSPKNLSLLKGIP
jgi:hypothetical protein